MANATFAGAIMTTMSRRTLDLGSVSISTQAYISRYHGIFYEVSCCWPVFAFDSIGLPLDLSENTFL